ncbi:hypothetical protein G6F57_021577 [Rhizopus arrhizus]|nr:hypothetical protein G6F57_021577 [Rhizopus arrhizus]
MSSSQSSSTQAKVPRQVGLERVELGEAGQALAARGARQRPEVFQIAADAQRIGATTIGAGTDVVHHHVRTTLGQQATVGQAQSTGGTGHQPHLAFKGNSRNRLHPHSFNHGRGHRPIPLTTRHDMPALSPEKGTEGIKSLPAHQGQ